MYIIIIIISSNENDLWKWLFHTSLFLVTTDPLLYVLIRCPTLKAILY